MKPITKKLAAEKIRARLERRLANLLECEVGDLPKMKIGTMSHALFLLEGDSETMGGFHTTMGWLNQILGHEVVWDIEPKSEETETPTVIVN